MASSSELLQEQLDGGVIITLGEEYDSLDGGTLKHTGDQLVSIAKSTEPPVVILDMTHTKFFGSAFIEVLVQTWNTLEARGEGRLILCGLQTYCREILSVTHLDEIWDLYPDRILAIESLTNTN